VRICTAPVQTCPGAHTASYTMGTGSFLGVKRPKRGVDHQLPSSVEVKDRVELYHYSTPGPLWPVLGWTLLLPLLLLLLLLLILLLFSRLYNVSTSPCTNLTIILCSSSSCLSHSSLLTPFSPISSQIPSAQLALGLPRFLLLGGPHFVTSFGSLPLSHALNMSTPFLLFRLNIVWNRPCYIQFFV